MARCYHVAMEKDISNFLELPTDFNELLDMWARISAGPKASNNVRRKLRIGKLHRFNVEDIINPGVRMSVLRDDIRTMVACGYALD